MSKFLSSLLTLSFQLTIHYSRKLVRVLLSGDYSKEVTPVPIPNTAVKLFCADDTWRATARENMSLPEPRRAVYEDLLRARSFVMPSGT